MYLVNENNKQLSFEEAKAELQKLESASTPSLADVQKALGDYYNTALNLQASRLKFTAKIVSADTAMAQENFLGGLGGNILGEVKKLYAAY